MFASMTSSISNPAHPWFYSSSHGSPCKVLEETTLWGQTVCRVWLPNSDSVVRVPKTDLKPFSFDINLEKESHRLHYVASAARINDVLGRSEDSHGPVLLAPMDSNVIPLPHQIHALARAVSDHRVRYLLADEVGLGKTVEAGLVMRELKLRGLVKRILIVAPKGIATQWISEMDLHFGERFQLILGEDIKILERMAPMKDGQQHSAWQVADQVIVSLDSVKPMDKRKGWSKERISQYNRSRFESLVTAGWDLVVVDEAHRLGGSTDQVARYRLGQGLSEAAPYFLLLSATPHQGKTDAFHRLMSLLDPEAFPDLDSVTRVRVAPYVIRTEKRKAVTAKGAPLFKPRRTTLALVTWESKHQLQQTLYEAVTDYVQEGYQQALLEKKRHIGFLMILMQRLVVSSTRAIRTTLTRRLEALNQDNEAAEKRKELTEQADAILENAYEMDGQELLDELLDARISALQNESAHVRTLLDAAVQCEEAGTDAKADALITWVYDLQAQENDADLKLLIFTEFVPTQAMLKEFLEARGISVVILNGSMGMDDRKKAQENFQHQSRVLISTDAGGEGLNLQFCHVVINYDMPWNPMRIEQRIGRVDRIGQPKVVRAINFICEDTVEFRVREVLEQKLAIIFEEFGIDKTGDVLDSAESGALFDKLFTDAILKPDGAEAAVQTTMDLLRNDIHRVREASAIYGISDEPDLDAAERLRTHPLPHWLEGMTIGFLKSQGGAAEKKGRLWTLTWPDGHKEKRCYFHVDGGNGSGRSAGSMINMENPRVRGLLQSLPMVAEGQPVPSVWLPQLPKTVSGAWGLFEIRLQPHRVSSESKLRVPNLRSRYLPVFVSTENKVFMQTAQRIWDLLLVQEQEVSGMMDPDLGPLVLGKLNEVAEKSGEELFLQLKAVHGAALEKETQRAKIMFESREKSIERLGLPEVQQYRRRHLEQEKNTWEEEMENARLTLPEMRPVLQLIINHDTEGQGVANV